MKNIILITIDCLRKDTISRRLTPFLWELGKKGVAFENCFSVASWTMSSFKGILTSKYHLMDGGRLEMGPNQTTLAQVLRKKGFKTMGLVFHPFLHNFFGHDIGFDYYFDEFEEGRRGGDVENRLLQDVANLMFKFIKNEKVLNKVKYFYSLYNLKKRFSEDYKFCLPADQINKRAINLFRKHKKEPFFCWIHYLDAHFPYLPKTSGLSKQEAHRLNIVREKWYRGGKKVDKKDLIKLKQLYGEKVKEIDDALKDFFAQLGKEKLGKDTIVVITSDHGDEFYEHGEFHHELKLYDELIHVPLILVNSGLKSRRITEVVSQIDLAPTILDLVGIESPSGWVGKSLFDKKNRKGYAISEEGQRLRGQAVRMGFNLNIKYKKIAIRTKDKKYIYNQNGQDELYDLRDDPKEQKNIARQGIPKQLKRILVKHLKLIERTNGTKSIE